MPQINLTDQDIKKVGWLSKLFVVESDENIAAHKSSLQNILNYVQDLSAIDASEFSPHSAFKQVEINDLRDDTEPNDPRTYARVRQNIINNFPARQGDFLQLPVRIIEEN